MNLLKSIRNICQMHRVCADCPFYKVKTKSECMITKAPYKWSIPEIMEVVETEIGVPIKGGDD